MIKNTTKLLISTLLLATTLAANDTLTQINFEQDSDGNLNPNIMLPIYWTEAYDTYSAIGYTTSTTKSIDKLNNFENSKNASISNNKSFMLNWYTKVFGKYRVGIQTNFIDKQNNEFGYIHDSDDIFGNGSEYYIAFDNDVDIDITKNKPISTIRKPHRSNTI